MNKFLHTPMQVMKAAAVEADTVVLDVIQAAFNLPNASPQKAVPVVNDKPAAAAPEESISTEREKVRS